MKDNKYVVLYVDDDQDLLETTKIVLEANDFVVVEATSAEAGLKKYKSAKPDIVIVDLMMEEVDSGLNLAKELRLLDNQVPVYLLSSLGDSLHNEISHSSVGITGILQKPVDQTYLISVLKDALE